MRALDPATNRVLVLALLLAAAGCRGTQTAGTSRYPKPIPTAESGPVLFSPGYVSSGLAERDASFSPAGNVFAFTQLEGRTGTIVLLEHGVPEIAPFSGVHNDLEPFFDPRGDSLWFASQRPHPDDASREDWNLWRVAYDDDGWGEPEIVRGLDGPGDEFYPTVSRDGTVAFTAEREGGVGGEDIWFAHPEPDGGWTIENAGPAVNSPGPDFNALLTPDGGMLVFSSVRPDDPRDQGGGDLYMSTRWRPESEAPAESSDAAAAPSAGFFFDDGDGLDDLDDWSVALPLEPFNSPALDYCPAVTPDGLYLVFTSRRALARPEDSKEDFPTLRARLSGPGNGLDDLWWVTMPKVTTTTFP